MCASLKRLAVLAMGWAATTASQGAGSQRARQRGEMRREEVRRASASVWRRVVFLEVKCVCGLRRRQASEENGNGDQVGVWRQRG